MPQEFKDTVLVEINHIRKEVICSICLCLFTEPVTLTTCQHTFCLECLKNLISNKTNSKIAECPMCKKIINRRSYFVNIQISNIVDFIKMCDKLQSCTDSNDIYDLSNRMEKFLNDCMTYKDLDTCVTLSTSSDCEADDELFYKLNSFSKLQKNDLSSEPKIKASKTPAKNPKSLKCIKVKGKYQKRSKKPSENLNVSTVHIDDYDSPGICDIQENKIVKLLEDDCLENMENEFHNNSKTVEEKNSNEKNTSKEHINKHESNFNWNTISADTNSSKKTNVSGWSRMKTMKKQIKKKEIKYKQLNVSTEINKSKSKSPELKVVDLGKESNPIIVHDSDDSEDQNNKDITEVHIKQENISTDKLDLFLQCLEDNKTKEQNEVEDLFDICTQKLQTPKTVSKDFDINNMQAEFNGEDNISNFVVDVQVHNCSTPVKNLNNREVLVEKVCSKRTLKDNICDVNKQYKEGNKIKSNKKDISNSYSEIRKAEKTPQPVKQIETKTRRSLRNSIKRNSEESNLPIDNKTTPKRKKVINKKNTDSANKIILKELKVVLVDENIKNTVKGKQSNINSENISDKIDFVKNELKSFPLQESAAVLAFQNSINAIKTVLSQCSTYVNTPSLFSESSTPKNNISGIEEKPNLLPNKFHSLQLKSNTNSSLEFYATAIPCMKNIETFFERIISLSQEITNETETFKNSYECKPHEEECVISFNTKSTKCIGLQTDNLKCPNCSCIIDFKSVNKCNSTEKCSASNSFKEINDVDNISIHYDNKQNVDNKNTASHLSCNSYEKLRSQNSFQSSGSEIYGTKKVNRQLRFTDDSSNNDKRTYKRIRSPTAESDSEPEKAKKSNVNYCSLLYKDDIDIFFQSEQSEKNMSLSTQCNDKGMEQIVNSYKDIITNSQKEDTVNVGDTTSKYISLLEREYKQAQFDKLVKPPQTISNFDTAPNTVLDNLLASINLTAFENDDFPSDKNTNLNENRIQTEVADVLSVSELSNKNADADETKIFENTKLNKSKTMINEDDELDKEVENITNHNINAEDSLGSEIDMFDDDNIVESTPQKLMKNNRERSRFNFKQLPEIALDVISPPPIVTENVELNDIAPPPPPEFQDTEKVEEAKVTNISSITPDIFALNTLDKGFCLTNTNLSGNPMNQTVKGNISKQSDYSEVVIPSSVSQNKELKENKSSQLVLSNSTNKKNLNPIVLAQKEKFSPLQIIMNSNTSSKPVSCSTPKQQKSILNYMQISQKENNSNELNKNINKMLDNPNIQSKSNALTPVKENLHIEVCESPVPHNKTTVLESKINTSENINTSNVKLSNYNAYITCTRLKREEILQVVLFTKKYNAKYCKEFDKNITHLIVSVDERNIMSDHTIKYILAISHGIWVVSYAWIQDSIKEKRLLPEEAYEVIDISGRPGPKISRLTKLSNPLFKNFVFFCNEPFASVDKVAIEDAIISLGGEVIQSPIKFLHHTNKNRLILVEPNATQNYDLYQDLRETYNVLVVDIEWLSFTLGQYQIISVRPYLLCLETGINDLGYSSNLIAPVLETPTQFTNTIN